MSVGKSVLRTAVMTTLAAACAAPTAAAQRAAAPPHQAAIAAQSVPPRVDSIGSRLNDRSGRVAIPIVQAPSNGGFDWPSAAIGAAALLSLILLGAAGWATVRGGRATLLRRGRAES